MKAETANYLAKARATLADAQQIATMPLPHVAAREAYYAAFHAAEYERNGTANLFMVFAPLEGRRHVKVINRHTAVEYAHVLKELSDHRFASAAKIVLVQDNLNIHGPASLYQAFPAAEARRLAERFEWHSQARQLARPRRIRTRRPDRAMPQPPHCRQADAD